MHDGKSEFRVPKSGLSEALAERIRAMAPQKLALGGGVDEPLIAGGSVGTPTPIVASYEPPAVMGPTYAPALMTPGPAYVQPASPAPPPSIMDRLTSGIGASQYDDTRPTGDKFAENSATAAAAAAAGIRPKDAPAPDQAAAPPPQPPAKQKTGGTPMAQTPVGPIPGMADEEQATREGRAALQATGDAESQAAVQKAKVLGDVNLQMQANAAQANDVSARSRAAAEDMMTRSKALQDEMRNVDTTVDPGRFWASRTTGQKIVGYIGMALGALGTGPDGINRSVQMIQTAIDRDIDAQKAEHAFRLKRGEQALEGVKSMYGMQHQVFQDEAGALAASRASGLELANNQLQQIAATSNSQTVKQQAALMGSELLAKKATFEGAAANTAFDNATQRMVANAQASHLYAEAKAAGTKSGLSQVEQSKVYEVEGATKNIKDNLARAKDIIKRKGTFELTGTEQTELERALGDAAQDSARLKDPGSTVREAELVNAKKAIGVQGGEILGLSNATALKLLDSYEKTIDQRRLEALRVRGLAAQ